MNKTPTLYTKDKNLRITFRCDEKLGDWIIAQASIIGLTPSAFVRQNLFSMMAQQARVSSIIEQTIISSAKAMTNEYNQNNQ